MSKLSNDDFYELLNNKFIVDESLINERLYIKSKEFIDSENSKNFKNKIENSNDKSNYFYNNILIELYNYYNNKYNREQFSSDINSYFNILFMLNEEKYINNFSYFELNNLKEFIDKDFKFSNNVEKAIYRFVWDVVGYTFGPIQLNIKTNYEEASKVLKKLWIYNV